MKCDVGHSHFDHGNGMEQVYGSNHNSHLTPTSRNPLSLGNSHLLPLTPTHPRHYYSHSHTHITELCVGVGWEQAIREIEER
jgi:hypothetical protein